MADSPPEKRANFEATAPVRGSVEVYAGGELKCAFEVEPDETTEVYMESTDG